MPPVYKNVSFQKTFDGLSIVDLRDTGLNLVYLPDVLSSEEATSYFETIISSGILKEHTYVGNFNRITTPKRLTFSIVPHRERYRYKGKDLIPEIIPKCIEDLIDEFDMFENFKYDSLIFNGYRYNGKDCISPHTDDEKFLQSGNLSLLMENVSVVGTYTLLKNPDKPMKYLFGDKETGNGFCLEARHGSLIFQGDVLHQVLPIHGNTGNDDIGRISVTLRKLKDKCDKHLIKCERINCPYNYGPSNYVYYNS